MLIPDELKLESYERRANAAVFDRLDLVVAFRAGNGGIGAVVRSFIDAIKLHDEVVAKIEGFTTQIDELKRNYRKKNRLFRNLDSAWNLILDNPVEYYEYLRLLPQMTNIERELEEVTDPVVRVELTAKHARFKELEPVCSKQLQIYNAYAKARGERDEAVRILVAAEKELQQLREQEKHVAAQISDDHITADEQQKPLSTVFPNVQVGYILSKINGENVEDLPFDDVIAKVKRARSPHNAVFLRYDFRYDPFAGVWRSLQELRELGVCVEDPLLQKMHFISLAAQGDSSAVQQLLMSGEDPNALDLTGNSAMVAAATNMRGDVVKVLFQAGADINLADKNMMTPLLYCASRGLVDTVKLLLDLGADRNHTDVNLRGPLFYAVLSGQLQAVQQFFKVDRKDITERLWGFTGLHLAANQGNLAIVEYLLSQGCSIYKIDKKGRTAEDVARECGHQAVLQRLVDERFGAPGQLVYTFPASVISHEGEGQRSEERRSPMQLWIGDMGALEVSWCADVDVTAVVYLRGSKNGYPAHSAWLRKDELLAKKGNARRGSAASTHHHTHSPIKFKSFVVPDDPSGWSELMSSVAELLDFVREVSMAEGVQKLVVCDDTCKCLAPAAAVMLMLIRGQVRAKEGVALLHKARPGIELGRDVLRGLQDLQVKMDTKLMRRLNARSRDSVVSSIAF